MIYELSKKDIQGLNQLLPHDWNFNYEELLNSFIHEPFFKAIFLADRAKVFGTGNIIHNGKIGWLGNIIVSEKMRGKGFGTKITEHLIKLLNELGCETQLLIATKLGEHVYKKLGFRKISEYQCFDSLENVREEIAISFDDLNDTHLDEVIRIDALANDENRSHLIKKFYKSGKGYFNNNNELIGFYLPNFGRGLIVSLEREVGFSLLRLKHSTKGKRTLLPIENTEGIEFLKSLGLKMGDRSSRMVLGRVNNWKPSLIFSYGSGYCG